MTAWLDPRNGGAGSWEPTRPHETLFDLLVSFLACLLGLTLLAGLVIAGRAVMCRTHGNAISYCSTAVVK